ncbi:hypothetical protein LOY46_11530 [Pseudomonas sichuanensis]|uniref:hypothetical protein n=1 Tax=Pseudomonas sichuanensis TaxID=2213015 RepID=UPI00215F71C5|nr:hypothetical protein [Pseudomonas sichuanensis]UVK85273.1 hypothetical protein LOY46_11530 [Pseudomonas sichuanensis]
MYLPRSRAIASNGFGVTLVCLHQLVALMPHDFAVQVIALVGQHLVLVEGHAEQVAAVVSQPADLMVTQTVVSLDVLFEKFPLHFQQNDPKHQITKQYN